MVEPLRIQKAPSSSSPQKNGVSRPLSELSPIAARRNSPSAQSINVSVNLPETWIQHAANNAQKQLLDTSGLETSPFASKFSAFTQKESPHLYWQSRDTPSPTRGLENDELGEESAVASKRPSVENLKRASRVSKSNIFALEQKREYDPSSAPRVERPLASGRALASAMPLGLQARNSILDHNKFFDKKRGQPTEEGVRPRSPHRQHPGASPERAKSPLASVQSSPTKSAMSQNPRYSLYDPETSLWSEADEYEEKKLPPGKGLHRHAKSVTFNKSPPEVNEYEQVTPDPSISADSREGSYDDDSERDDYEQRQHDRDGSQDSFDECLEDTDKTPVVLPEDWRHMSPEHTIAYTAASKLDDPFVHDDANHELANANAAYNAQMSPSRTDSMNSNGSRRPLPPLPPPSFPRDRADSHDSLEAVAERAATSERAVPSPPRAAAVSKDELRTIGSSSMSLEERLSLMSVQSNDLNQTPRKGQEETRERRMRRKSGLHNSVSEREIKIFEDSPQENEEDDGLADVASFQPIPRISRESILRKVRSQKLDEYKSPEPENFESDELPQLNPDEPIRSYEESPSFIEGDDQVVIKDEDDEGFVDMYAIPEHSANTRVPVAVPEPDMQDDTESQYSTDTSHEHKSSAHGFDDAPPTPRAEEHAQAKNLVEDTRMHRMSLPGFSSMLSDDFGLSLSSYMTPSPHNSMTGSQARVDASTDTLPAELAQRPETPELSRVPGYSDEELREPNTPDSVIRRSVSEESINMDQEEIPEPVATIKAPGSKIKTRSSLTPQDIRTMAEVRRQVSGGQPPVPSIPDRHANRPSMIAEAESFLDDSQADDSISRELPTLQNDGDLLRLELSVHEEEAGDLSFGLDKEFDRVIEAQKKGYLMRQNTKMVVASSGSNTTTTNDDANVPTKSHYGGPSSRETRSANNSPVKKSKHEMSGAWQTHEWNGKMRRKSIRQSGGIPSEFATSGVAPPLPGMPSAVSEMESLSEVDELETTNQDGGERGRLFVRVVGLKDLKLPLPRNERSWFALTLDNGLHCVTTTWLELGKTAHIGQEFELVVLNDLEFQLTLQTKLEQPKAVARPDSPTKLTSPLKKPGFSRFFGSPKKKKEQEMKQEQERLAKERQQNARVQPSAWDLLHNLVGKDGSFARSYVSLKEHENQAFGRLASVDIPCYNEWAMEEARTVNSTRNGRAPVASNHMQRRAPYNVGTLQLELLYVPKPKDAKDEDMPKSMTACVRELNEAEKISGQIHEGYLSQQGGDCPYWRRRFFRLVGSRLTAFHEATHQPRATINLAKAVKLIDDKSNLKQQTTAKSGGRRKSAFGSEEDGYMFLEEGFRIRFANGETIDFYADNIGLKDGWMQALADVVGQDSKPNKGWTDIVLKHEKAVKQASNQLDRAHAASSTSGGVVPGPRTSSRGEIGKRPSSSQDNTRGSQSAQLKQSDVMGPPAPPAKDRRAMGSAERRAKARSTYY